MTVNYHHLEVIPGRPYPMGPIVYPDGVRFTLFSRHATRVWLALFDRVEDLEPVWEYEMDPARHRIGDVWSIFVRGLEEGALFKYRVDGPFAPELGHRYNRNIYLLDPYAKAFVGDVHDGTMKCVAVHDHMDWTDDIRPRIPLKNLVIYETHVKGFTRHPSSGVAHPGTYAGFIEKIPWLKELGVNAVELLPIQEMGENYIGRQGPDGQELTNYWGYSTIGFFAPTGRYAISATRMEHLAEFRSLVRALHSAGIEIILDVVFNHTSEGNELGPTLCFKGIDNAVYYLLRDGQYLNFSGCGNTLNCNHPLVRDFILDCLRYWVAVMHIDGFRFDLASILGRDQEGNIRQDAPLLIRIAEDPVLRETKLIAEAWDAGGAYQVGSFGGHRWAEWNGLYRDEVRRYWRGDPGMRPAFATRLAGSSDLYYRSGRTPCHSINFVTCHDGFTLRDLVSYNRKHNEANGENNRDGMDENYSWNSGVEGETDNPGINALRLRRQKNFIATLFLSLGVPMMLGGDEFGRTQRGNNNAYCQDNEISWYDWTLAQKNAELVRFTRECAAFRRENPVFRRDAFYRGLEAGLTPEEADILWFDETGGPVNWHAADNPLACQINARVNDGISLYLMFNPSPVAVMFTLPPEQWYVRIDTAAPPPDDIISLDSARRLATGRMVVTAYSLMVLSALPKIR